MLKCLEICKIRAMSSWVADDVSVIGTFWKHALEIRRETHPEIKYFCGRGAVEIVRAK